MAGNVGRVGRGGRGGGVGGRGRSAIFNSEGGIEEDGDGGGEVGGEGKVVDDDMVDTKA